MKKLQNIFNKKKLSYEENAIFFETLSELMKTGISIVKIFDISIIKLKNKDILPMISENIQEGNSLSYSLENSSFFSDVAISIVKAAEESGNLSSAFEKLSAYYYRMSETKKNITASLFYPCILLISILSLMTFIIYYFIPSIVNLYNYDMSKLGLFTRSIFNISLFLNRYSLHANLIIFSLIAVIYLFLEELYINRNENNITRNLPLISKISNLSSMSNILWTYFLMYSSGISISKATEIIKNQTKNKAVKEKLLLFEKNISRGKSLSFSIKELNLKDEQLIYFLSLGEQSGNIEKYLSIVSDLYAKKLSSHISYISQIIQPVLIVLITFIVGIIISGIVLPALNYDFVDLSLSI